MNGRGDRAAAAAFVVASLASIGLLVVYVAGGDPQAEGVLLSVALGGIGVGLVVWSHELIGSGPQIEQREPLPSSSERRAEFMEDLESSSRPLSRRLLIATFGAAGASLAAALVLPARSLGPAPGRALFRTAWAEGRRLVTAGGSAILAADLEVGNVVTVFPEGSAEAEEAATLLIRVEEGTLELDEGRLAWAPGGLVAYSKICTHVGCPVGLYRESTHELICPCHQSTFDVLRGARPVFGPATRALPQLPIGIDSDGYLVALGDYPEPVGAGFWNRGT